MSNLTKDDVVVNAEFELGARNLDSRQEVVKDVTMTLTSQGVVTAASQIPASALGFDEIYAVDGLLTKSDNTAANAWPSFDGSLLLTSPLNSTVSSAVALTGTFNGRIRGLGIEFPV